MHGEGLDVRVELDGNAEARDGARADSPWERRRRDKKPPYSPPSHLLCDRLCLLHTRLLVIPEVCSVPLIMPLYASVELVGM